MRRLTSRLSAAVAVALCCALIPATLPRVAFAQKAASKEVEEAKKKFFEGMELETQGKWGEALKRFTDVGKVRMTPQVRFHIALCEEHEGMLIEALRDFEVAESDAKASNPKVETVAKEAPEHAAALKAKIPKLKIKLPGDVENVSVTVDGQAVDAKGADEISVNPGTHKIEATADKMKPFSQDMKLDESESKTLVVKLVPIDGTKKEDETPPPKKDDETPKPATEPGSPVAAFVVGGIGIASLVGAGAFYLMRNSAKNDLDNGGLCNALACSPDAQDTINKGKTYNTLTNVFAVVGLIGVSAGIVLYVTTSSGSSGTPKKEGASLRLLPSAPGANLAGLALSGAF
jgi:hypothetical protein